MRQSTLKKYLILNSKDNQYLYGRVYNDKRFPNGHLILTTRIIELNKDETMAITENKTENVLEDKLTKEDFIKMIKQDYIDQSYVNFLLSPLKNV